MLRIAISELKAGMVIAKPVTNESGMVLLSEGTVLSDSMIARLGRMDIRNISVEGESPTDKSREQMLDELEMRFKKTGSEPNMSMIKDAIKARIEEVYQ